MSATQAGRFLRGSAALWRWRGGGLCGQGGVARGRRGVVCGRVFARAARHCVREGGGRFMLDAKHVGDMYAG